MCETDPIGDLLRNFYKVYGRPDEGPSADESVTRIFGHLDADSPELDILRDALDDHKLRKQFIACSSIVDGLIERLNSKELLVELSQFELSENSTNNLSNGIFWYYLATAMDRRDSGLPILPTEIEEKFPINIRFKIVVQGSLICRLYIALVYMREGALGSIINQSAREGGKCSGQVRRLLNCDYLRRIRNALSHGSFDMGIAGIVFKDDDGNIVATPEFLKWLSIWLMEIQMHALAAVRSS